VELHVVVLVFVLDLAAVRRDLDTFDALLYELSGNLSFWPTDICLSEEELPVEIRYIDSI